MVEMILFLSFGAVAIAGAMGVIAFKNPVHSALGMILTFFAQAGLFILLGAYFIAAVQVIVYAGAIMVLFLFVVMLLNLGDIRTSIGENIGAVKIFSVILAMLLAVEGISMALNLKVDLTSDRAKEIGTAEQIGELLFTDFVLPFEVTSLILLTALIGVITVAKREINKSVSSEK